MSSLTEMNQETLVITLIIIIINIFYWQNLVICYRLDIILTYTLIQSLFKNVLINDVYVQDQMQGWSVLGCSNWWFTRGMKVNVSHTLSE